MLWRGHVLRTWGAARMAEALVLHRLSRGTRLWREHSVCVRGADAGGAADAGGSSPPATVRTVPLRKQYVPALTQLAA